MLKGFENKDAPLVKKLVVHPDLPYWLCKSVHIKESSPQQKYMGDLEMIAFYYILRVGAILYQSVGADNRELNNFR